MGRKRNLLALGLAALVVCLLVFSIKPRVLNWREVDTTYLDGYSELRQKFDTLCAEETGAVAGRSFFQVTYGNWFHQDAICILPCYETVISTVPQNGNTPWSAKVQFLVVGENCPKKITMKDFAVEIQVGAETFVSSRAELDEGFYDMDEDRKVHVTKNISIPPNVKYVVEFLTGTSAAAQVENEHVEGFFTWSYTLSIDGVDIATIEADTVGGEYIVNAT